MVSMLYLACAKVGDSGLDHRVTAAELAQQTPHHAQQKVRQPRTSDHSIAYITRRIPVCMDARHERALLCSSYRTQQTTLHLALAGNTADPHTRSEFPLLPCGSAGGKQRGTLAPLLPC
jgi:hypothetical protein